MHRGARGAAPRSIASFFGGGFAARPAAPLPRAHEPPQPPPLRSDGAANAALDDAALPARAEGGGEEAVSSAFEMSFGFAAPAPVASSPAAVSPPPLRVFSRKRRASAPPDGAAQLASPAADASAALPATPAEAAAGAAAVGGSGRRSIAAAPKYKQLYLDLGQAGFGHATCVECGMMYARGESGDEAAHASFHATAGAGIRFRGWQRERVTWRGEAGARCVHVAPGDPAAHAALAARVAEHVTTQLGLPLGWLLGAAPGRVHALLLVSAAGRVDGACFAERLGAARRVRPATEGRPGGGVIRASRHREAAAAGVRAVWVAAAARRRGAASALLDAARTALGTAGAAPPPHLLAFSQPTECGRALAARYVGTQAFLVYDDTDVGQHPDPPGAGDEDEGPLRSGHARAI